MSEVFYTMLTNAGKAKIANATILNTKVNFSKIAVGDSNGSYYNPTEVQTSLVHEVWKGSVGNIRVDEHNSNWIVVESIIPPTTGGFMIREVGLFDDEGDLLVIAKYPETYKPTANDGTVKELVIKLVLEVANTSVVTLKIDPTVIVATKQDIIDMGNKKANLIHNHNDLYNTKQEISTLLDNKTSILDKKIDLKLGKTEKAIDSEKLDGLDSLMFARSYSACNNDIIPRELLKNASHNQSYIGMIDYGLEVGLSCAHSKIIYMSHNTDGYGTQIAIPYESGNYHGVFYRNATGTNWGAWIELIDTRDRNTIVTTDANTCMDSGKAYYCVWNKTSNLPLGTVDDGIIIPYMHIKGQFGFQIYMTWNSTAIYWRKLHSGNWDRWYCIGGGSWNQEVIKDSEQVGKYLRWGKYGQNHVIFDASKGVRPDGQACSSDNPAVWWQNTYPYLMGFNGTTTYGVKVNMAQWADGAGSIHGFQFRNNNGRLEVLINGVWLSVGGRQYTVTRSGMIGSDMLRFDYSGGAGVLRILDGDITSIDVNSSQLSQDYGYVNLYIDGVKVGDLTRNFSYKAPLSLNIEFKNSINIVGNAKSGARFIVQTEK